MEVVRKGHEMVNNSLVSMYEKCGHVNAKVPQEVMAQEVKQSIQIQTIQVDASPHNMPWAKKMSSL